MFLQSQMFRPSGLISVKNSSGLTDITAKILVFGKLDWSSLPWTSGFIPLFLG